MGLVIWYQRCVRQLWYLRPTGIPEILDDDESRSWSSNKLFIQQHKRGKTPTCWGFVAHHSRRFVPIDNCGSFKKLSRDNVYTSHWKPYCIGNQYPVWLGRLTHLLHEAQSHWPPFCFHSQLCKNDTRAAYQKTRMSWNWVEYFKSLRKLDYFQQT